MREDKNSRDDAIRQHLYMGSLALAALGAGGGEGETGFNVVFDLCCFCAAEVEDGEEGEGGRPGVEGVGSCC